jgi:hypothetical protein
VPDPKEEICINTAEIFNLFIFCGRPCGRFWPTEDGNNKIDVK